MPSINQNFNLARDDQKATILHYAIISAIGPKGNTASGVLDVLKALGMDITSAALYMSMSRMTKKELLFQIESPGEKNCFMVTSKGVELWGKMKSLSSSMDFDGDNGGELN